LAARVVIPLLIDENVPDSVTNFLRERGHDIKEVRELSLAGSPDPIVAAAGDRLEAVVVTFNHRDFKKLAARIGKGGQARLRRLGRINFRCAESKGRQRVEQVIDIIEMEYERASRRRDKRLLIDVTTTTVSIIV
jgi:predicted nuclease of predicted toxin-antitoxin system